MPDTHYSVTDISTANDGNSTICLTEVSNGQQRKETETANGSGTQGNTSRNNSGESGQHETSDISQTSQVQRLSTYDSEDGEVQSTVPQGNTTSNNDKQGDLQGLQTEVKSDSASFTITENTEYDSLET